MKSKVTIDMIMSWHPCDKYDRGTVTRLFKSVCGKSTTMSLKNALRIEIPAEDIYWLVLRTEFLTESAIHNTAIFCWDKIARPIWEKHYPNDKRPHEAIRIKKLWLAKKATDQELAAARAAARAAALAAAGDAARAAALAAAGAAARAAAGDAAGDAAGAAARAAARDAALAAACDAARAAALAAAGDAAWDAANKKIINYIKKRAK